MTSANARDNFIAKYNPSGVLQWAMKTNLASSCEITGLAVATHGIYASYNDGPSDGGVLKVNITSHLLEWKAPFYIKSNSSTNPASNEYNRPYDITVDNSNGIYICGAFKAQLANTGTCNATFKNSTGAGLKSLTLSITVPGLNPVSEMNMFLVKYSNLGVSQWAMQYGNSNDNAGCTSTGYSDEATGVTYNANQNCIYLTGHFIGQPGNPANFGLGFSLTPTGSSNNTDLFLARITVAGVTTWVEKLGSNSCESGGSVISDNTGNVYITGRYEDIITAGCYSTSNLHYNSGTVIAKYGPSRSIQWMTNIEVADNWYTTTNGGNFNIACDNSGFAYPVLNMFTSPIYPVGSSVLNAIGGDGLLSKVKVVHGADAGPDVAICCGSIKIGTPSNSGCTYSWTPTSGLTGANTATPTCTKAGTYTVTTNCGGCISSDQVVVTKAPVSCCRIGQYENAENNTSEIEYNIYPNPSSANTSFFIESNNTEEVNGRKISVYSIDGSLVMKRDLNGSATEEVKHNLSPGMYVIIIQSAGDVQKFKLTIVE